MNTLLPNSAADRQPLPPSKAERISSWVIRMALVPALALQTIGAVPRHALRDAGLGTFGDAADRVFDVFHGTISSAIPSAASWADAIGGTAVQALYFGALSLVAGAFVTTVACGMRRMQKNSDRSVGGPRCW